MKVGDLIKFRGDQLGTILDTTPGFGGYALVWVSGEVTFENPTRMNLESLKANAEVISESL